MNTNRPIHSTIWRRPMPGGGKLGALVAAGALALSLTACTSGGDTDQQPPPPPPPGTAQVPEGFGAKHDWSNGSWVSLDQPGVSAIKVGEKTYQSVAFPIKVHNGGQQAVDAHLYRADAKYNGQVYSLTAFGVANVPGGVVNSNQDADFVAVGEAPPPNTHVEVTVSGPEGTNGAVVFGGDTPPAPK